jgi:hypothetical protein
MPRKHAHYFRSVEHLSEIDIYRMLDLFGVTDQALGHAIKKLVAPGGRGAGKDFRKDVQEAIDTLQRRLEMLDEDQAAALYITGSSLSGYAFDVSVHIWQRYPGKTSLPSEKSDAFPAMNTEDWFDSYVPCCVLHVPAA